MTVSISVIGVIVKMSIESHPPIYPVKVCGERRRGAREEDCVYHLSCYSSGAIHFVGDRETGRESKNPSPVLGIGLQGDS